uniref:Uncharacterized protein n=1 Tax=Nelumbo nucifera TaxID=4432 RepID=A0A822ZDM0_NELNU|nr:TPA_asm: hypothetical protein HUJ06_014011 [Nelumbo nucifera]
MFVHVRNTNLFCETSHLSHIVKKREKRKAHHLICTCRWLPEMAGGG